MSSWQISINSGFLEAYVRIHPDDVLKVVCVNQEFRVRFTYILGRPNVLDVPFLIETREFAGFDIPDVEILSVTPETPHQGVSESDEVGNGVVTAIVREDNPDPNASPSEENLHYVYLDISTYQPEFGTQSSQDGTSAAGGQEIIDNPDSTAPALSTTTFGDYVYVSWNLPSSEINGVLQNTPVDYKISVSSAQANNPLFYGTRGVKDYFGRLIENITIGFDLLRQITNPSSTDSEVRASGPQLEEYESARVTFRLKHPDGVFGQDDQVFRFNWPLRVENAKFPAPENMMLTQQQDPDRGAGILRWRLRWEQPYFLGVPGSGDFDNLWVPHFREGQTGPGALTDEGRELFIDRYEYRSLAPGTTEWGAWQVVEENVRALRYTGQVYETVLGTPTVHFSNLAAGQWRFQGRARNQLGVYGGIIELTQVI